MKPDAHLNGLARSLDNPLLGLIPRFVQRQQTGLSTTLNELVGFRDEFGIVDPLRDLGVRGNGVGGLVPGDLGDLGGGEDEGCREIRVGLAA